MERHVEECLSAGVLQEELQRMHGSNDTAAATRQRAREQMMLRQQQQRIEEEQEHVQLPSQASHSLSRAYSPSASHSLSQAYPSVEMSEAFTSYEERVRRRRAVSHANAYSSTAGWWQAEGDIEAEGEGESGTHMPEQSQQSTHTPCMTWEREMLARQEQSQEQTHTQAGSARREEGREDAEPSLVPYEPSPESLESWRRIRESPGMRASRTLSRAARTSSLNSSLPPPYNPEQRRLGVPRPLSEFTKIGRAHV